MRKERGKRGRKREIKLKKECDRASKRHKNTQRKLRKLPCRQRGGSESSAAEHFDKSSSVGRT